MLFRNYSSKKKQMREFREAKKDADGKNEITGRVWYVIMIGSDFVVVDNRWRKGFNEKAKKKKLQPISFSKLKTDSMYTAKKHQRS